MKLKYNPARWECEPGWYKLIEELVGLLDAIDTEWDATQVKEKFGTLRFYVTGAHDYGFDLIETYEGLSGHVCERCGEFYTAKLRGTHWVKTLCDKCAVGYGMDKEIYAAKEN